MSSDVPAGLTVRDAPIDRPLESRPPAGAPNVVAIVLDDTGFGQLGCFGSDIATPHIDALARGGLRYNRFHVTSLCSPTRAAFLTGRNHHAVGMGFLADIPLGYPGYTARIPKSAAPMPRVLRDNGYATMAVGKWHLVPRWQRSFAGPFDSWPLGLGFEHYYGFLQGDTNHWSPNLVADNHYVDPPRRPEDGYHLTEDLADVAIRNVKDHHHAAPGKPFFLYFALGAMHAPHHVAPEWVAPYRGAFDDGWDAWRARCFSRQLESGVVPPGTTLSERPQWVSAWDALSDDERRMMARQQEVFAGFLTHTDAQIGRLLAALDEGGHLDNTIVLLFSDNGASAEGGVEGSANEHRFTARIPESLADNLTVYDDWGGFRTYNHYSWGWAWAGNTPNRLWKRYTWLGGTRTPLVVHWPAGIDARSGVRSQLVHVNDLWPTLADAIGIELPAVVDGVTQQRIDGSSIRATFSDPAAPDPRSTQYFEMLGSRSIIHDGWKATTNHISTGVLDEEDLAIGSRDFGEDRWELFRLADDFSESHDVAGQHPEVVGHLAGVWLEQAEANNVLPIDDTLVQRLGAFLAPAYHPGASAVYLPDASPVVDESLPMLFGGFTLRADVTVGAGAGDEGVLCALGDWNGGFALFLKGSSLFFAYARADQVFVVHAPADALSAAGRHVLEAACMLEGEGGRFVVRIDGADLAAVPFEGTLPLAIQHGGTSLRLGHDAGFPVTDEYAPPFPFTGTLHALTIATPAGGEHDADGEIRAALHHD